MNNAAKGVGILAVIVAVASFIPFIGVPIAFVALVIATVAAFLGDKGLTIATLVLCAVKMVISPTFLFAAGAGLILLALVLFVLPIVGIVRQKTKHSETSQ